LQTYDENFNPNQKKTIINDALLEILLDYKKSLVKLSFICQIELLKQFIDPE